MAKYFINSGHTLTHDKQILHSGRRLPDGLLKKEQIERLMKLGAIVDSKPVLNKDIDNAHSKQASKVVKPEKEKQGPEKIIKKKDSEDKK